MSFSESFIKNIAEIGIDAQLFFDEPMSNHCSFKTGGNADLLMIPKSKQAVEDIINLAKWEKLPVYFIGNGTNLLVSDKGIRGIVVKTAGGLNELTCEDDVIFSSSGVSLLKLCLFALENSLSGLEFAYGIPASVGGAVYMNAGAYGGEIQDRLIYSEHLDEAFKTVRLEKNDLEFSYRHSFYCDKSYLITGAAFRLEKGDPREIKAEMNNIFSKRKEKQPLEFPSAGSTFKRPEGFYAAALIDECGLKGRSVGGAQVSEKHAGFIINKGGATTAEILELIELVRETVRNEKGVTLETEVKKIGF